MKNISPITWLFLALGLTIQIVTYILMPNTPLSLASGMLGICSVVLGAQGNILTFVFGFAQVGTYTYLCVAERFYGEIGMNIYYFVTMIYGVILWQKRLESKGSMQVQTRTLSTRKMIIVVIAVLSLSILSGVLLQQYTDDSQPYLDAFTTVPALVAQILMMLAYREQWYLWIVVDILATIMWLKVGNYCMAAQYAFWCMNCIYGYTQWTKSLEKATEDNID